MAFENLFIRSKKSIGGIELDAVLSETHNNQVRLSKNPIEFGADITDHAVMEPKKINIIAQVSDTPLGSAAFGQIVDLITGLFGTSTSSNLTRSNAAYRSIEQLMEQLEPINVQTKLKLYSNMVIVSLSTTQDKDTSRAVLLNIVMEEVLITESKIIKLTAKKLKSGATRTQGASSNDRGSQEGKTPDSSTNKSVLKSVLDWVG